MKYKLMNKDKALAEFEIVGSGIMETVKNISIINTIPSFIDDISSWIGNRSAAKHRKFIKELLQKMQADTKSGFIGLTHCLSLQDTLWVKEYDSDIKWEDVNLFENDFSEVMTHLAFDGTGLYGMHIKTLSPELTTDGTYDKCWIKRNGDITLLKCGSTGARNAGLEPYCEYLSSQFYTKFCKNAIPYGIEAYRNRIVSSCLCFTNEEFGYKPISLWLDKNTDLPTIIKIMEDNIEDMDLFKRMVVADCVMVNSDRHFGNFGFLMNNNDYSIKSMAPLFDYNMALSPFAEFDIDFPVYSEYLKERGPVFGGTYEELGKLFLTSSMRSDLIALKDLKLTLPDWCYETNNHKWTKKRTEYINEIKNTMIDRILGSGRLFTFEKSKQIKNNEDKKNDNNELIAYDNIRFPGQIHDSEEYEYEPFE